MRSDQQLIRENQIRWFEATHSGDAETISELMTADAVFLTAGRPPFGRQEFLDSFNAMKQMVTLRCEGEFEEIQVHGETAIARANLKVTVTPKDGGPVKHLAGHTLSFFIKSKEGNWQLSRDANLLTPIEC